MRMKRRHCGLALILSLVPILAGCTAGSRTRGTDESSKAPPTPEFPLDGVVAFETIHFDTPQEGETAIVRPGIYHVDRSDGASLRLRRGGSGETHVIAAAPFNHAEKLPSPRPLLIDGEGPARHLFLARSDGTGLQAVGYVDGTRTRAYFRIPFPSWIEVLVPKVTVTTPAPGSVWPSGSWQYVRWTSTSNYGTRVKVALCDADGGYLYTINGNTPNDGALHPRLVQAAHDIWYTILVASPAGYNPGYSAVFRIDRQYPPDSWSPTPAMLEAKPYRKRIAGGRDDSLVVKLPEGHIYRWGRHEGAPIATPQRFLSLENIAAVSSGRDHAMALTRGGSGRVLVWGDNAVGQLGISPDLRPSEWQDPVELTLSASDISAGATHSLAIVNDAPRSLYGWGDNGGAVIKNPAGGIVATPVRIEAGEQGAAVVDAAAGECNLVAICARNPAPLEGELVSRGGNIGNAPMMPGGTVAVAHGAQFGVALFWDGRVYVWGANHCGQNGNGTIGSTSGGNEVPIIPPVKALATLHAEADHCLVIDKNGRVHAWGRNDRGQVGDPGTLGGCRKLPYRVPGLENVIAVAAGYRHSMALTADGTLYTWGDNEHGQLGNGTIGGMTTTPQAVLTGLN